LELTTRIKYLKKQCPDLLESLLPRSEQQQDEDEAITAVESDAKHLRAAAVSKIKTEYCSKTLKLPVLASKFDTPWRQDLIEGYRYDYGKAVNAMGSRAVRWYKKLSFNNP
jgi:hypothetical protein